MPERVQSAPMHRTSVGKLDGGTWLRYTVACGHVARRNLALIECFGALLNAGMLDTMHVALTQMRGCT